MRQRVRRRLTKAERQAVYDKCKGHCAYCGCGLEYNDMQVDHAQPLRCGGADTLNNMLPACRSCNHYKATLGVEDFRKYIEGIPKRLTRDSIPFAVGKRFGVVQEHNEPIIFYFERMMADER